jgi:hypothetical protein
MTEDKLRLFIFDFNFKYNFKKQIFVDISDTYFFEISFKIQILVLVDILQSRGITDHPILLPSLSSLLKTYDFFWKKILN